MAEKLENVKGLFANSRTRVIIIVTTIVLGMAVVVGISIFKRKPGGPGATTTLQSAPSLQSIPGGFDKATTAEYAKLQTKQNIENAERAEQKGGSAIPTIISAQSFGEQGLCPCPATGEGGLGFSALGRLEREEGTQLPLQRGPIGVVCADGTVRDSKGNVVGKTGVAVEGSPVYDAQGRLIGTVGADGKVRDANGNIVGTVGADGIVRDANGKPIGIAGVTGQSGAKLAYDKDGNVIGTIGADGKVRDANGNVIGTVGADGVIRDASGKVIGNAGKSPPGSLVYDAQGHVIGTVGADGKVRDANGNVIGTVGPDGVVRDANGKVIGNASTTLTPGNLVYDKDGKVIGTIGPDGKVRDANGKVIGTVGPDGIVRDANGRILGKTNYVTPGAQVVSSTGEVVGTVNPQGTVTPGVRAGTPIYDANGKLIGTIGADGKLRDPQGNIIGRAGAVTPAPELGPLGALGAAAPAGPVTAAQSAIPPAPGTPAANQTQRAIMERQAALISEQRLDQMKQQIQSSIATQAGQLFESWRPPTQTLVAGAVEAGEGKGGAGGEGSAAGGTGAKAAAVKAGSVMFAVLETAVNSDEPGPVMATLVQGPFKGGRLVGTLTRQDQKLMLNFNLLSLPSLPNSISINAVAIDPDTARTALSSETNNHYLLRYGTLFASAFIQGYGQAVTQSGATIATSFANTTTGMPSLSPKDKIAVALGNVGTQWGNQLNAVFNMPPTVRVYSGTGLGVLFVADVVLPTTK